MYKTMYFVLSTHEFSHKHVKNIMEFRTKFVDSTPVVMICPLLA